MPDEYQWPKFANDRDYPWFDRLDAESTATLPPTNRVPITFEYDPEYREDLAADAPPGTPVFDGVLVKDVDVESRRVYRLKDGDWAHDGKLLDRNNSGVFWIPPAERAAHKGKWWHYVLHAVKAERKA